MGAMVFKLNTSVLCWFILFFLLAECSSSSPFLSDGCPVDFEHQNYTIITSQCKGPKFAANSCCTSFKEFACPFAAELNDLTNDCATIMFSYIRTYGNYPPGLFANMCRDTKQGLDCTSVNVTRPSKDTTGSNGWQQATAHKSLVLAGCLLVLAFL